MQARQWSHFRGCGGAADMVTAGGWEQSQPPNFFFLQYLARYFHGRGIGQDWTHDERSQWDGRLPADSSSIEQPLQMCVHFLKGTRLVGAVASRHRLARCGSLDVARDPIRFGLLTYVLKQ